MLKIVTFVDFETRIHRKKDKPQRKFERVECFAPHSCPTLGQDASGCVRRCFLSVNDVKFLISANDSVDERVCEELGW